MSSYLKRYLFPIFFLAVTCLAFADTWSTAVITVTYSQNKVYMLKVYPRTYPDNYFSPKYRRQYRKGIVTDTISPCYAVLYHIKYPDTTEIWNKPLVNFTSPVKALVADDGKSVITLDDWGRAGRMHTMVVYGESGEVIKDFDLEDITPFPMEEYFRSISSSHWGRDGKYMDNDRVEIYFQNEKDEKKTRVFNIKNRVFEE